MTIQTEWCESSRIEMQFPEQIILYLWKLSLTNTAGTVFGIIVVDIFISFQTK